MLDSNNKKWLAEFRRRPIAISTVLLLLMAFATRLLFLNDVPGGLNQDEASIAYDAWALLHFGIDRWGLSWPVHFIAWGSGQNALYAYLSMPFIAIWGISAESIRIAAAVLGCASTVVFWRLGKALSNRVGFIALLVIVTSPWHIMASRWALESNAAPAIVLFGCYFLALYKRNPRYYLPIGAVLVTLSIYAYGTAYLFAPLFLASVFLALFVNRKIRFIVCFSSMLASVLVALPLMVFIYNNAYGDTHISLGPFTIPKYPGEARYSSIFLLFSDGGVARVLDNIPKVLGLLLAGNHDGLPWNASPYFGAQYAFMAPFWAIGLVNTFKTRQWLDTVFFLWLCAALLTAFGTDANINRINLVWLPSLWFIARGISCLAEHSLASKVVQFIVAVAGMVFCIHYFVIWHHRIADSFFLGLDKALELTINRLPADAPIGVTGNSNPMSTLLFAKVSPHRYVQTVDISDRKAPFVHVRSFDRFTFGFNLFNKEQYAGLVVHKSELYAFDPAQYEITITDNYASVIKSGHALCHKAMDFKRLQGSQDYGRLGINKDVEGRGRYVELFEGYALPASIAVHGRSTWSAAIPEGAQTLRFGIGMGRHAECSDGLHFNVVLDGENAFSKTIKKTDILFHEIPVANARKIELQTVPGKTNWCDHGVWIMPVYTMCP